MRHDPAVANAAFKTVGSSGQIALGKRFAGKTLKVEHRPDGTILLTSVALVPDSQLWTLQEPDRSRIARGLAWAAATPRAETDLDDLVRRAMSRRGTRRARGRSK